MAAKYNFLFINPVSLPSDNVNQDANYSADMPKEQKLRIDLLGLRDILNDVEWDFWDGPVAPSADWVMESRAAFAFAGWARQELVQRAVDSKKYNGIVCLGGTEPGINECREIGKRAGIPVMSCAFAAMHCASMLGHRFSVIDMNEIHNMYYYDAVLRNRMTDRCASLRNLNLYHPRAGLQEADSLIAQREKALNGEKSIAVDRAIEQAELAIREDGAQVITFGCSDLYFLKRFVKSGLEEKGYDVPVLEGYSCAIEVLKMMVDLGENVSGLWYTAGMPANPRTKVLI